MGCTSCPSIIAALFEPPRYWTTTYMNTILKERAMDGAGYWGMTHCR